MPIAEKPTEEKEQRSDNRERGAKERYCRLPRNRPKKKSRDQTTEKVKYVLPIVEKPTELRADDEKKTTRRDSFYSLRPNPKQSDYRADSTLVLKMRGIADCRETDNRERGAKERYCRLPRNRPKKKSRDQTTEKVTCREEKQQKRERLLPL